MSIGIDYLAPYAAEIHLTYRCDLACRTCNRACFVKPAPAGDMTVEAFEYFLRESVRLSLPLKYIILLGGEPTLHRDFPRFVSLARDYVQARGLGGQVEIFSNGFGSGTRQLLDEIKKRQDPLCSVIDWTMKPAGSVEFAMNTMYVSPVDVGLPRQAPCPWHHFWPYADRFTKRINCGISVDSQGYTICPLGGTISRVIAPHALTRQLKDLLDRDFTAWQTNELCRHCGCNMEFPPEVLKDVPRVAGMLMSHTWAEGFKRLEREGLRLVDGLAKSP